MKTITLKIQVPEWAKWLATDDDGATFVYSHEPESRDGLFYMPLNVVEITRGKLLLTLNFTGRSYPNWRKSKRRIKTKGNK
jgi:hypothetical protein